MSTKSCVHIKHSPTIEQHSLNPTSREWADDALLEVLGEGEDSVIVGLNMGVQMYFPSIS